MPWRRTGRVEVWLHPFFTSALDGGKWSASRPGSFSPREKVPGTHWVGDWMGPKAGLDTVVRRKIPSTCQDSNLQSSSPALYHLDSPAVIIIIIIIIIICSGGTRSDFVRRSVSKVTVYGRTTRVRLPVQAVCPSWPPPADQFWCPLPTHPKGHDKQNRNCLYYSQNLVTSPTGSQRQDGLADWLTDWLTDKRCQYSE
jgi:hypothetical protein